MSAFLSYSLFSEAFAVSIEDAKASSSAEWQTPVGYIGDCTEGSGAQGPSSQHKRLPAHCQIPSYPFESESWACTRAAWQDEVGRLARPLSIRVMPSRVTQPCSCITALLLHHILCLYMAGHPLPGSWVCIVVVR